MIELHYTDGCKGWLKPDESAPRRSEAEALKIAHDELVCEVNPADLDVWMPDWREVPKGEVQ